MQKSTKSKCTSVSHHLMKDNTKNRLNDFEHRLSELQAARKEGRINDVSVLENEMFQIIHEWKAELDAPSPASSLFDFSLGSFSDDINRLLQLDEEKDDATSALQDHQVLKPEPGLEPIVDSLNFADLTELEDHYLTNMNTQGLVFQGFDKLLGSSSDLQDIVVTKSDTTFLDGNEFIWDESFNRRLSVGISDSKEYEKDLSYISPPPSAFMGPKCALWDCARPPQGCEDYCSNFHATVALNEGAHGRTPVLRPRGIGLKDNIIINALKASTQGKNVGIPRCEGAASTKSPWNATELFDISLLEGETIREWLFFDKPRRAFDSGNRKQRSLPDHNGRGWHESRKQSMVEFGGHKRSYYMDPQPSGCCEWHLFEYEINNYDDCALYRLEMKLVHGKKNQRGKAKKDPVDESPKGKVTKDPVADLQKKMGRLTAEC